MATVYRCACGAACADPGENPGAYLRHVAGHARPFGRVPDQPVLCAKCYLTRVEKSGRICMHCETKTNRAAQRLAEFLEGRKNAREDQASG